MTSTANDCSKDREFSQEVLAGFSGPEELRTSPVAGSLIETVGKIPKETNMRMENFLAVVRGVAGVSKRCASIDRLNCAS